MSGIILSMREAGLLESVNCVGEPLHLVTFKGFGPMPTISNMFSMHEAYITMQVYIFETKVLKKKTVFAVTFARIFDIFLFVSL